MKLLRVWFFLLVTLGTVPASAHVVFTAPENGETVPVGQRVTDVGRRGRSCAVSGRAASGSSFLELLLAAVSLRCRRASALLQGG